MIRHLIIMSSSYSKGMRIALDLCREDLTSQNIIYTITKIKAECGNDVSLSSHFIYAASESWASVIKSDPFFKNVHIANSVESFIKLIKRDLELKGVDIAQYILSKKEYTHLELEKLTYLCYADYLCSTGKKLFKDKIYAYKYGPVIKSVYNYYKKNEEPFECVNDLEHKELQIEHMPIQSKILFSVDGIDKIKCVEETLSKYGCLSASSLIELTHMQGSPWSNTKQSDIITDKNIKQYHKYEQI